MLFYILVISISIILISGFNIWLNPLFPWYTYIIWTVLFAVAAFAIDAVVAIIVRKLPEKGFNYQNKIFNTSSKMLKLFELLGVKKWKEKVPELGQFTNFRKNHVSDPKNPEYLKRFLLEACYGIVIHEITVPFSLLMLLIDYRMYTGASNMWLTIGIPVFVINSILSLMPAMILRYNLPKLSRLYEKALVRNK